MLSIVSERLPKTQFRVLKDFRMGVIELGHVVNQDMLVLAKLKLRARRLEREIQRLEEASLRRKERQREAWLASLG